MAVDFSGYSTEVRLWLDEIHKNCGLGPRKMEQICKDVERLARKTNDARLMGYVYFYRGQNAYLTNSVGDLFKYCLKGMEYQEKAGEWEFIALSYNLLGITSMNQGNVLFAIDYYLNGLTLCDKHQLMYNAYILNMNVGSLYVNLGDCENARRFFKKSLALFMKQPKSDRFHQELAAIYIALADCAMREGKLEVTGSYLQKILDECYAYIDDQTAVYVAAFQVRYCHAIGQYDVRDILIREISEKIGKILLILDMYDDFYEYTKFLLQIDKFEAFEKMCGELEKLVEQSKLTHLRKQLASLKLEYYKKTDKAVMMMKTALEYYELSLIAEKENAFMANSIISMRTSLEEVKKVSENMEQENKQLQEQSKTDALTGLANRFHLNIYAEHIFEACKIRRIELAVEILDVDYFKQFNDNYGHQAGDDCIVQVAHTIRELEKYGHIFCARYGGDEFVIIYDGYDEMHVKSFARELKQRLAEKHIPHEYSKVCDIVTISQGICFGVPEEGQNIWDFLSSADNMLYKIKKKSRNNFGIGKCEIL